MHIDPLNSKKEVQPVQAPKIEQPLPEPENFDQFYSGADFPETDNFYDNSYDNQGYSYENNGGHLQLNMNDDDEQAINDIDQFLSEDRY